jgi:hypothetical protein
MVELKRDQIRRGVLGIDVTVMSSSGMAKLFAPTWELVMGSKNSTINHNAYSYVYGALLKMIPIDTWHWLAGQKNTEDEVTLLCYCNSSKFCHTHLIALYAEHALPDIFTCKTEPPECVTQTEWYLELANLENDEVQ